MLPMHNSHKTSIDILLHSVANWSTQWRYEYCNSIDALLTQTSSLVVVEVVEKEEERKSERVKKKKGGNE